MTASAIVWLPGIGHYSTHFRLGGQPSDLAGEGSAPALQPTLLGRRDLDQPDCGDAQDHVQDDEVVSWDDVRQEAKAEQKRQ